MELKMKTTTKYFGLLLLVPVLCSFGCQRGLPGSVGDVESSNVQEVAGKFELQATVGGAAEVALPEPTGFANITGKISVVGKIAEEKFVNYAVNKDENVCSSEPNVRVQVDGNGGLQWGLLFYDGPFQSGDDKWDHPDYMSTANATLDGDLAFDQKACIFLSRIKAMRVGQTLKILNSDSVGHNAKLDGLTSANLQIGAGADVDYKPGFQESKPFGVSCSAHPWMGSYIIVRDNPLYTVTGEDGSFEIRNIPSGIELPMKFWHEVIPSGSMQVTINGASQEISRGGFELPALEAGEDLNLEIVINADAFNNAL
tara:strand:+ start:9014 stop:9952 length:939 start_codon:yes stop_codon:yes gene_type:complete